MAPNTNLETECYVSGPLSFVLRVSRVLGIAPISGEKVRNEWRTHVSRPYYYYGQIIVIIYVILSTISLTSDLNNEDATLLTKNTNANLVLSMLDLLVVSLMNLITAYTGMDRMRQMIHCIAMVKQINHKLSNFCQNTHSIARNNNIIVIYTVTVSVVTLGSQFIILNYTVYTKGHDVIMSLLYFFYLVCCTTMMFYVLLFNQMVLWVLPSFRLLNLHLRKLLQKLYSDSPDYSRSASHPNLLLIQKSCCTDAFSQLTNRSRSRVASVVRTEEKANAAKIRELGLLYCSLTDVTRILNDSNGLTLVVMLITILLQLVITPYHLISGLFHSAQDDHSNTPHQVLWAIFHFSKLLLIVEPCHRTCEEMDVTKDLINQIRRYTPSEDLVASFELKLFYRHLILNQVTYSPLQLFTINRTLIAAILGNITTYLVIVIQL